MEWIGPAKHQNTANERTGREMYQHQNTTDYFELISCIGKILEQNFKGITIDDW